MPDNIDPKLLNKILKYDPETGKLTWLERTEEVHPSDFGRKVFNSNFSGKEALTGLTADGYRQGSIFSQMYRAHRVIWAIYHEKWPSGTIDHINGIRDDNRIINLRDVSFAENQRNKRIQSNNKSGVSGVHRSSDGVYWVASIKANKKTVHLGSFFDFEDAKKAREDAERKYGYHQNHGSQGIY